MATLRCAAVPLVGFLHHIEDPRVERAWLHSLHNILVTTILAVICGADSWTAPTVRASPCWIRRG